MTGKSFDELLAEDPEPMKVGRHHLRVFVDQDSLCAELVCDEPPEADCRSTPALEGVRLPNIDGHCSIVDEVSSIGTVDCLQFPAALPVEVGCIDVKVAWDDDEIWLQQLPT